jgi:hypothetical protein
MVRDRLPRVMLSLRTSGATYFSGCAFLRLPNLDMNSGLSSLLGLETGRERSVLRKSVTGLVTGSGLGVGVIDGFLEVESGGGMVVPNVGLDLPTSGLSTTLSGLGFVAGGDLTGSASMDVSLAVGTFWGVDSEAGTSDGITGDFFLKPSGAGFSTTSDVSGIGAAFVSSLKSNVSSFVVGAAIFSDS